MSRTPRKGNLHPQLFTCNPFEGFGPSRFRPTDITPLSRRFRSKQPSRFKQSVRKHAPKRPGVYGMLDAKGRVIYIGKAKNLRCRLLSYFRVNSRDPKAAKIVRNSRVLLWEETTDEFAALLRELELIQRFRPRFNVLGQPGMQRYHYLCLGRAPAPFVYISKAPTGKELGCYGPLVKWWRSEAAARRLNDWFQLRDCPQTVPLGFRDQGELFPTDRGAKCMRFEIGTCRGPCAAACSTQEYAVGTRGAKAFLEGRDRGILKQLQEQMEQAAAGFEFEKATALRDRLQSLEWLDHRLTLLRRARDRNSCVYPLAGPDDQKRWYLIHRGEVHAVIREPQTATEKSQALALITSIFADRRPQGILAGSVVDSVLLVAAWFNKYEAERAKLLTRAEAVAWCEPPAGLSSAVATLG